MPDALYPWIHIGGRILFSLLFIVTGLSYLTKAEAMTGYARSRGAPLPRAVVLLDGVLFVVGGLMVLLGWRRFIGAGLLAILLIPNAFALHAFWKESDPTTMMNEMMHFLKDLALAGAALFIAYHGAYAWPMAIAGP